MSRPIRDARVRKDAQVSLTAEALLEIVRLLRLDSILEPTDIGACLLFWPAV